MKNLGVALRAFGIDENAVIHPFGNGLINHTWKIASAGNEYILQKVNHHVFTRPENIAHNSRVIEAYLKEHHPGYLFVAPIALLEGEEMLNINGDGYYRLFPFVNGSHAKQVAEMPEQAYEAAKQFGRFTRLLSGLATEKLIITIPHFHDLGLRYQQFKQALEGETPRRIKQAETVINQALSYSSIVDAYRAIRANPAFKLRVTHHDTKIGNVLFDAADRGLCVIDLDTVMPGYFISDVGDMMRTYLSPVSEEESDVEKIVLRNEFYNAIAEGYLSEMKDELTIQEKDSFLFAGRYMTYMQALRFLTDYLNDDVYYGAGYKGHNLVRATNQLVLLEKLTEKGIGF